MADTPRPEDENAPENPEGTPPEEDPTQDSPSEDAQVQAAQHEPQGTQAEPAPEDAPLPVEAQHPESQADQDPVQAEEAPNVPAPEDADEDEDEPITFDEVKAVPESAEQRNQFERNKRIAGIGLLVVLLGVAGFFFWKSSNEEKTAEGIRESQYAFAQYEQDSLQAALNGNAQFMGLEGIAEEYAGTPAGNQAQLLLAGVYLKQGDLQAGKKALQEANASGTLVEPSRLAGLAYAYEQEQDFAKAAETYEQAAGTQTNDITSPELLQHAARCYLQVPDTAQAITLYKRIYTEYPNSQPGQQAPKFVTFLGGSID